MQNERRASHRIPVQMFLNEYVAERPGRALATNVSDTGLYVSRVLRPTCRRDALVQVEFTLPGTSELIWAAGEARFDALDDAFHSSGVRFVAMARAHERMIRDWVVDSRRRRLRETLDRIRRARAAS